MTCASCVQTIESYLHANGAVSAAKVNLLTEVADVSFDERVLKPRDVIDLIQEIGFDATIYKPAARAATLEKREEIAKWRRLFFFCLSFAVPHLLFMVAGWIPKLEMALHLEMDVVHNLTVMTLASWILSTPVMIFGGWRFFRASYLALRHRAVTMDVLIAIGTGSAYLYSVVAVILGLANPDFQVKVFFEVALFLVTFVMLGRYLENMAKGKTSEAITKLLLLQPAKVSFFDYSLSPVLLVLLPPFLFLLLPLLFSLLLLTLLSFSLVQLPFCSVFFVFSSLLNISTGGVAQAGRGNGQFPRLEAGRR